MGDLERMGRELKCPICWSLIDSAVSLTCNHLFCNSCIIKSMKLASACPVCKIPFTRREVRPAPHMDNLVNIYKSMEVASGINIFVTQNVPDAKLSDGEKQCEGNADSGKVEAGGSHTGHVQEKKTRRIKKSKVTCQISMGSSGSGLPKPSFPAKKRVHVPQNILSETPMKNLKLGDSPSEINKEIEGMEKVPIMESERPLLSEKSAPVLSPFFWLREEKDGEKLSQPTDDDQIIDGLTPNPPSFSDLKDSDDDNNSNVAPFDGVQNQISVNLFDSEMFEWTQRPCSPELFSSPSKIQLQVMDTYEDDDNQDELVAASQERDTNLSNSNADNIRFENPKGNKTSDVLPPSVSAQIRSYADIKGKTKSRKRGRKAWNKIRQEQIGEPKSSIDGMHVDANISLAVTQEQALDYKHISSNLGKASRRGKTVCFNTSSIPSSTSACTVPDTCGVLSIGEKIVTNLCTSPCKQENEKHCPREIVGISQKRRSAKQNMDQTNKFAGSASSIFNLQTDDNVKSSKSKQGKNMFSRELRTTKRRKLSSLCTSITNNDEEILPNENIHQGPNVRELNDTSLMDKTVLRKCQSNVKMYQCVFCLSSEESEASGPMVHYFDGKPVTADYEGGSTVTHCHRNCTEWAPNVYFDGDNAINLEAEISRSRRIKCSFCGLKGAALGCYEKSCRRSFHVPCAKWTSLCRWDAQNFVMLCPIHASSTLPCEGSGSQKRSKKCPCIDDKNHGPNLDTTSQTPIRPAHKSYKKIVLCCSALSVHEKEIVSKFVSMSKVAVLKNWDSTVTHVIASTDENGACRRTLKVLLGILEGKWILKVDWIKACTKELNPVDEERYEINVDIHGIRDGPRLGRLRVLNKQPKLFDGYKFYFMGDFIPSYKGYLQDLVVAAGGIILHRKPVSGDQKSMLPDRHPYQTLILYSLELPDNCVPSKTDTICSQRCHDAEVLASSTGSKVVTNTWILNSIAACKLQCLAR